MVGFAVFMDFIRHTSRCSEIISWKKIISARKFMMWGREEDTDISLLFENNFFPGFHKTHRVYFTLISDFLAR